jgi:hypothetical protein
MHPAQPQNENANVILHTLFSIFQFSGENWKHQKCNFRNQNSLQEKKFLVGDFLK